jgi:tetrahydromethanopterin S-methyltransferase subunit A
VAIPILKEGDYEITNNSRPVSLLTVASKICEQAALNQFMEYMSQKGCLTEHQSRNKKMH